MIKGNVMENVQGKKDLTILQKILLFAFISLIVGLYQFIMNILILNIGIGELRYPRLYLQVVPGLYIIHMNYWKRSLKFPHLILVFLILLAYVLFEEYLSPSRNVVPHHYNFFWNQLRIYIFFLMLVNFGLNRLVFYKVIDYTFYSILLISLITYVGYLGFFDVAFETSMNPFIIKSSLMGATKPSHLLNINTVSYLFVLAILLLIVKQLNEKRFSPAYILRDFTVILLLVVIILINSARGAFIISIIFICYYIYFLWHFGAKDKSAKVFVFMFILLVSILFLFKISNILVNPRLAESQISIIKRSREAFDRTKFNNMLRVVNAQNAWKNFLDYPFTGVGFHNGSKREQTGTISDGQHLHILASYGIIFFIMYIYYHYKLFMFNFNLLKKPEIALGFIFVALSTFFTRPHNTFAIIAYIAIFFYYNSKSTHSNI